MSSRKIRLKWAQKNVDRRFPEHLGEEAALLVKSWWKDFKMDPDPRCVIYDSTEIVNAAGVRITKAEVWQIFHKFLLQDEMVIYNIMPRIISHSSTRCTNIEMIWNKPCDTIVLQSMEQTEYTLTVYPTEPFKAVFYACTLPVGVYICDIFEGTFEITASIPDLAVFETPLLFHPVPEERVQKAWGLCSTLLKHRGYRSATKHELESFIETHRRKYALAFCIDPLRNIQDRVCWRSPEFIEKFGDVKWLQVEHDQYEEYILAILHRTPPTGIFRIMDQEEEIIPFHLCIVYASQTAHHALFIGAWIPLSENYTSTILMDYYTREMTHKIPFNPTTRGTLRWFHGAYNKMLVLRGYRIASPDEITGAIEESKQYKQVCIMDLLRPFEQSVVYQTQCITDVFGYWPPTEVSMTQLYNFIQDASQLQYRSQTLAGDILNIKARCSTFNNETKLITIISEWSEDGLPTR